MEDAVAASSPRAGAPDGGAVRSRRLSIHEKLGGAVSVAASESVRAMGFVHLCGCAIIALSLLLGSAHAKNKELAVQLAALQATPREDHRTQCSFTPQQPGNASAPLIWSCDAPSQPAGEAASAAGFAPRAAAGAFALSIAVAPYYTARFMHRVPFGHGGHHSRSGGHTMLQAASYKIDQFFSTNASSKPLALLALTGMLVLCGSAALFAVSGAEPYSVFWASLAGVGLDWTFAGEEGTSAAHRACALLLSVGGMLVTALMLGVVSDAIGAKMDDLRKGRSDVLEEGHTLILGWSDKLLPIIRQLALANESEGGGVVVILADRDKEQMDAEVSAYLSRDDAKGTFVVCRQGSPLQTHDLARVSAGAARAIIVLADSTFAFADAADGADAATLRVVLSLAHMRDHGGGLAGHVVAEVCDIDNEPLVRLVGGPALHTVVSHDVIGRIMLQCARQPGLSFVFEDLLGFDGNEFYRQCWPALTGRRFDDVAFMFPDAVPCGIVAADGTVTLNPKDAYVLREDDALLVVAEDDDSYAPSDAPAQLSAAATLPPPTRGATNRKAKVLFAGWRRDLQDLVMALDEFSSPGSELWLFCELTVEERLGRFLADGLDVAKDLKNLTLHHAVGDPVSRKDLDALPLETFDSVLIIAHAAGSDAASSNMQDSKTLATLLLIRDIQAQRLSSGDGSASRAPRTSSASWVDDMRGTAARRCAVISEILDTRTRHLVADSGLCDYVLSNELISHALSMVAEEPSINAVLRELFTADGQEMLVQPASAYVRDGERLSFWDVAARARARREVLIGTCCADAGVVASGKRALRRASLNPGDKHVPRKWGPDDFVVIMGDLEGQAAAAAAASSVTEEC